MVDTILRITSILWVIRRRNYHCTKIHQGIGWFWTIFFFLPQRKKSARP